MLQLSGQIIKLCCRVSHEALRGLDDVMMVDDVCVIRASAAAV